MCYHFMIHLKLLSQFIDYTASNGRIIMNDALGIMWEKLSRFKVLS
jgi:hypothetical protein